MATKALPTEVPTSALGVNLPAGEMKQPKASDTGPRAVDEPIASFSRTPASVTNVPFGKPVLVAGLQTPESQHESAASTQEAADLLKDIYNGKYKSRLKSGLTPDPDIDSAKFREYKARVDGILEANCKGDSNPEYCSEIRSLSNQATLENNPIVRAVQGPLKGFALLIQGGACDYWGSAEQDAKNGALKTFFKTLLSPLLISFAGIMVRDKMAREAYNLDNNPNRPPPAFMGAWNPIVIIARLTMLVVGIGVDFIASPMHLFWGIANTINKTFGGRLFRMERSSECQEAGWFND